jgi:AraC family transcriptional regulator
MLTNALRSNSPLRFERNILPTKRPQAVILPIGGSAEVSGRTALGANKVGVRKVQLGAPHPLVAITPADKFRRRMMRSAGMTAEIVQETGNERIEYRFQTPVHLLILFERGVRREGDTDVEGLPRSSLRDLARKFVFVPAGHTYCDWHEPSTPARVAFFYFDPAELPSARGDGAIALPPRLFFEDPHLFATAQKLIGLIEGAEPDNSCYIEALGRVLAHELMRLDHGSTPRKSAVRGGLAGWQQRIVTAYIEDHLADPVSLADLAELVGLSAYHFCRAFKQSFGIPPLRYHASRRIDRAKALLAKPAPSVTKIGLMVGYNETSTFTAAFRKATGLTPTAYHRGFA